MHAEESLLGRVYDHGPLGGFGAAVVVGAGGDRADWCDELVDCVSERLVLGCDP